MLFIKEDTKPNWVKPIVIAVIAATVGISGSAYANENPVSLVSRVSSVQDHHGTAIDIGMQGHPAYNVKTLNGGYRIQIIWPDAHFSQGIGTIAPHGNILDVLTVNKADNAEMDILLKSPEKLQVSPSLNGYRVLFPAAAQSSVQNGAKPNAVTSPIASQPVVASGTSVSGFHFERGHGKGDITGAGVLNLSLTGSQPELDAHREGGRLVITLKDTRLPSSYTHQFGVSQFGTQVRSIESYMVGRNTHLVFDIHGPYAYSAYQLGQTIRIMVYRHSQVTHTSPLNSTRLSMDFQNINVRDAIQVIANFTHQNIVVSNNVNGSLTIRLKNEPWKEALQVILESQGLAVKKIGNILWVAPAGQITKQEQDALKASASERKMEPLETQLIQIKYAKAASIASLLEGFDHNSKSGSGNGDLSTAQTSSLASALGLPKSSVIGNSLLGPRGSVSVVTRTNSLLVRDTPQDLENIKKLIEKIDKPVPQVLIEARIVQITTSAAHSLGVNWGGTYTSTGAGGVVNLSGTGATGATETQGGAYPISGGAATGGSSGSGFTVPSLANLSASSAGTALASADPASYLTMQMLYLPAFRLLHRKLKPNC